MLLRKFQYKNGLFLKFSIDQFLLPDINLANLFKSGLKVKTINAMVFFFFCFSSFPMTEWIDFQLLYLLILISNKSRCWPSFSKQSSTSNADIKIVHDKVILCHFIWLHFVLFFSWLQSTSNVYFSRRVQNRQSKKRVCWAGR